MHHCFIARPRAVAGVSGVPNKLITNYFRNMSVYGVRAATMCFPSCARCVLIVAINIPHVATVVPCCRCPCPPTRHQWPQYPRRFREIDLHGGVGTSGGLLAYLFSSSATITIGCSVRDRIRSARQRYKALTTAPPIFVFSGTQCADPLPRVHSLTRQRSAMNFVRFAHRRVRQQLCLAVESRSSRTAPLDCQRTPCKAVGLLLYELMT